MTKDGAASVAPFIFGRIKIIIQTETLPIILRLHAGSTPDR